MKTLQSNFTTPERSKQLLELGVPADSADCYKIESELYDKGIRVRYSDYELNPEFFSVSNRIPIWSVGRLMEILRICSPTDAITCEFSEETTVWRIVRWFDNDDLDFSKLEE